MVLPAHGSKRSDAVEEQFFKEGDLSPAKSTRTTASAKKYA